MTAQQEKAYMIDAMLTNDTHGPADPVCKLVKADLMKLPHTTLEALWAIISLKELEADVFARKTTEATLASK